MTPSGERGNAAPAAICTTESCWLITYPLSGWLMTGVGPVATLGVLAARTGAGLPAALRLWPADDPEVVEHTHDNLPLDHPHLRGRRRHAHPLVVDDIHPRRASRL
jgi:hypothetical protein